MKKKLIIVLSTLVIVSCIFGVFIGMYGDQFYKWIPIEPDNKQMFIEGIINDIKKVDSNVDGTKILYSIELDNGKTGAITKNTRFYLSTGKTERSSGSIKLLKEGQYIEMWVRLANDHLIEIVQITIEGKIN